MTASTSENRNPTITNRLENGKVPDIVRMEKARTEKKTTTFEEMAEGSFGLPYHGIEATTFENTTQTITNRLKNEKMKNIGTIKDHKVLEDVLLRDIRRQPKGSSAEMEDKDTISCDKAKSGEYALDRPPKKPRKGGSG